jgi:hypothetical protein
MDEALYMPVNPLLKLLYKSSIAQMGYGRFVRHYVYGILFPSLKKHLACL